MFLGKEDFRSKMKRVFLDISIDGVPMGRIEIELFCDLAPLTTENFRSLCTGEAGKAPDGRTNLCYKGSTFHRIVKGFMIQGGDITFGDGRGGCSIYGSQFDDEEFAESHSKPYLVSMANKGPNTNSSQFFITTSIAPHCDNKHVVFGRVVRGQSVVNTIESVKSDESGRPAKDVIIVNCGELFKKKKENSDEKEKNKETKKNGRNDEEEEKEKEDEAEKLLIPECPKSWLYREDKEKIQKRRRSISREKRRKRERKEETHRRGRSIERRRIVDDSGIQVRGRGGITYRKDRSITPIHWKINAPKKTYKMKKEEKSIIDLEKQI